MMGVMLDDEIHHAPRLTLNDSHRRHIAASLRHAAELLDEAEHILILSRSESPFRNFRSDLAPWQTGVIVDHITAIRRKLADAGREMGLNLMGGATDARHAIRVHASFALIDVEEMHARYTRGYGSLDTETARRLDALADALANAFGELERALAVPPGESIDARIERLARSPVSPEILRTLDQLITRYHVAELRRPMATLVERIEQRTFNIAVFGRVSSGKSSLLNALIGAPILPVGVTPITAVPTRVRLGEPPSVRIVYGDKREETVAIERLAELASEAENPGNRRRVALLQVRYPSPLLREGIELVDTPGIGSLATQGAQETFAYLPRADLAILLVDVGSAIGPDELSVLRLLQAAAVPVQVVISKADLADAASLARMDTYVLGVIAKETGLAPAIHPVSAMPAGEPLLRRWIDQAIQPLLDAHETMLEASIRRTTGAIRDAIAMRLETIATKRPANATANVEEEAREVVLELRRWIAGMRDTIENAVRELLRIAATQLLAGERASWNAHATVASLAQQYLDDVRADLLMRQWATKDRLRELAQRAGIAPELMQLSDAAGELQRMPLLDVTAVLPSGEVPAPLLASETRLARRLYDRLGTPLRDVFRGYGTRLHDWAMRSLDRLQASFTSAIDATHGKADVTGLDLSSLDDDLRALAALTSPTDATQKELLA
jgi:GTP-binding protein EngB required for normal cell division